MNSETTPSNTTDSQVCRAGQGRTEQGRSRKCKGGRAERSRAAASAFRDQQLKRRDYLSDRCLEEAEWAGGDTHTQTDTQKNTDIDKPKYIHRKIDRHR